MRMTDKVGGGAMSRVALYVDAGGAGLGRCARAARVRGDRVVVVARERSGVSRRRRLGPVLRRLVARMQAGEFEAVVAALDAGAPPVRLALRDVPDGSLVMRPEAAIYARYASMDQAGHSTDDQMGRLRDHAASRGWNVVGAYVDPARSGRTLDGRSGFADMMAAAERGAFQVLLVEDIDRISRDAAGLRGVVEALRTLGVVICTLNEEGAG